MAKGAARSLCVINETLYYLSPDGVMAWDGSIPTKVSTALDPARLRNVKSALGGALDGRYYLHLVRGSGEAQAVRLLVYDTERGLWQEEDVCSYEMAGSGGSSISGTERPSGPQMQTGRRTGSRRAASRTA